jgi:hypothetical protein
MPMLYRIAEFQSRRHPAWDENLSFSRRIEDLPLYALEFNNPDRDRETDGPTIAHYSPARAEIACIANLCTQLDPRATLLDIGCGNGFIGSLIAREGIRTVGIDNWIWRRPQIRSFYDPECYELRAPCDLEAVTEKFDAALCSWMVPNANLTGEVVRLQPTLIIHVMSPDFGDDGSPTTGCNAAYELPAGYRNLARWVAATPADYFHALDPCLTRNGVQLRIVEIWARQDGPKITFPGLTEELDEYPWEKERMQLNSTRIARGLPPTKRAALNGIPT